MDSKGENGKLKESLHYLQFSEIENTTVIKLKGEFYYYF